MTWNSGTIYSKIQGEIRSSNDPEECSLATGQAALWFHYKIFPESVAYNLAGAATIPVDTDLQAMRRAFQRLADRHPMLRTLFLE